MLFAGLALATSRTPSPPSWGAPAAAEVGAERPLAVDPAMRALLPTAHGPSDERMADVLAAVDALGLRYADGPTGTAADVVAERAYNCLSLAHLLVALGREQGVDVGYVRVRSFRGWRASGDEVLVSTHVAAGWGSPGDLHVVDPMEASPQEERVAERISDQEALALHRSNVGVDHLLAGDAAGALAWFDAALRTSPGLPEALVNRGVALRRLGDGDAARAAWAEALAADPARGSAQVNLAGLALRSGDAAGARALLAAATASARDPHALLALGDLAAAAGDPEGARRACLRAARAAPGSATVRAALGELALAAGDRARAERWRVRAERRDPDDPRVRALREALATR